MRALSAPVPHAVAIEVNPMNVGLCVSNALVEEIDERESLWKITRGPRHRPEPQPR